MESLHDAKNPRAARISAWTAAAFVVVLGLSLPLWVVMSLSAPRALLLLLMLVPTVLFLPAVVYLSVATPPVTLTNEGVRLRPLVLWRETFIAWADIESAQPYPLIPSPETEIVRKALVGRRKYAPAEGVMLISSALPLPYRVVGFFAGQGNKGVVAFTNRTHADYETLVKFIAKRKPISQDKKK